MQPEPQRRRRRRWRHAPALFLLSLLLASLTHATANGVITPAANAKDDVDATDVAGRLANVRSKRGGGELHRRSTIHQHVTQERQRRFEQWRDANSSPSKAVERLHNERWARHHEVLEATKRRLREQAEQQKQRRSGSSYPTAATLTPPARDERERDKRDLRRELEARQGSKQQQRLQRLLNKHREQQEQRRSGMSHQQRRSGMSHPMSHPTTATLRRPRARDDERWGRWCKLELG